MLAQLAFTAFICILAGFAVGFIIGFNGGIAICQMNHPWEPK